MRNTTESRAARPSRNACGTATSIKIWETLQSESNGEIVNLVRCGLPSSMLSLLAKTLAVSTDNLYALLRIKRKKEETTYKLSTYDSDKIVWAIRALQEATQVLESPNSAREWLTCPVRSLGGVTPLSLLDTSAGFELVRQTLRRIEHGICA